MRSKSRDSFHATNVQAYTTAELAPDTSSVQVIRQEVPAGATHERHRSGSYLNRRPTRGDGYLDNEADI